MAIMKMNPEEIKILRKVLKMSEGEFAERIECKDREAIKLLESGAMKPTLQMQKILDSPAGSRIDAFAKAQEDVRGDQGAIASPLVKSVLSTITNFTEFQP